MIRYSNRTLLHVSEIKLVIYVAVWLLFDVACIHSYKRIALLLWNKNTISYVMNQIFLVSEAITTAIRTSSF